MAFVKIRKTKPYFKRFQTKFRRRREGKTDYYARKALIMQDRDKYNTPKYRLVVRRTNGKIICQIIYATIKGDRVLCQANSTELRRYGLKNALTNYAASYATGLLIARRLLKQLGMEKLYAGNQKLDGGEYHVSDHVADERRPFKCFLDVGLTRTTNGNRVFAALKGACDGGLDIPHNTRRFPGFSRADDEEKYDAKKHRERIFGVHVQNYMNQLKKEGDEAFKKQFSLWADTLKSAGVDTVEKLFTKIHTEIRAKPEADKKKHEKKPVNYTDKRKTVIQTSKATYTRPRRLTREERLKNVEKKIAIAQKAAGKKKH